MTGHCRLVCAIMIEATNWVAEVWTALARSVPYLLKAGRVLNVARVLEASQSKVIEVPSLPSILNNFVSNFEPTKPQNETTAQELL